MRRTAVAVAGVLLAAGCSSSGVLAGTAGHHASGHHSSGSAAPRNGTLRARVAMFGGPLNPRTDTMALVNQGVANAPITVTGPTGTTGTTRHRRTAASGNAVLALPPGRYVVTFRRCGARRKVVTVHAGRTTRLRFDCDVP